MSLILNRTRLHVRCSKEKCKKRAVFARHPDDYRVPRKCEGCGGTKFRIIKDRNREAGNNIRCDCAGRVFSEVLASDRSASMPPHRRGSPNCWFRSDGTMRMPGDPDFSDPNYSEPEHEQDTTEQAVTLPES